MENSWLTDTVLQFVKIDEFYHLKSSKIVRIRFCASSLGGSVAEWSAYMSTDFKYLPLI